MTAQEQSTNYKASWGVAFKMSVIPAIFLLAIAVLVVVTTNALNEQRSAANRVTLACSLRIYNQQHFKEILLRRAGTNTDYQQTRQRLVETLGALRDGGNVGLDVGSYESVAASKNPEILKILKQQEQLMPEMFAVADEILELPQDSKSMSEHINRLEKAASEISERNETLVNLVVGQANIALEQIMRLEWTVAGGALFLGLVLSWLVSRSILLPLNECVGAANRIRAGDLTGNPIEVNSRDEVGRLTDTFNQMRASLRELLGGVSSAIETLGASCSQIMAAAKQQAAGATEQAAAIQETTSTMEEVAQTGNQVAERARQVAAEAEATSSAAMVGIEGVKQASLAMDNIRRQVEALAENVVNLSEKTQAVGEVIGAVKDIAERSSLLALNAAIEAAAAGDEGRSFSVVAAEMKSLAEQSREATVTVRRILEEIQRGINTSVMLTEETVKRVETGRQHTENAETTIRQLNQKVEDSVQAFQQITAATNQQQIGFEQVSLALRNIEQATEQTVAATRQLEASVVALNDLSGRMRTSTEAYRL
mgnify:CR=1 FL=1